MQSKFSEYVDKGKGLKQLNEARFRHPDGTFQPNAGPMTRKSIQTIIAAESAETVKEILLKYLKENEHSDWDMWDRRDIAPIYRFLEDFTLYLQTSDKNWQPEGGYRGERRSS